MTDSKVTRSQLKLGPLTINYTRAGRLSLVAGIFLAVLMVALAAYGGVRLFDNTDDSPRNAEPEAGPTRSGGHAAALPPTTATIRHILPDRSSMDAQEYPWAETPEFRASAADISICRLAPECQKNATAAGAVMFGQGENKGENQAEFLVLAFSDAAAAHLAYTDIVQDMEEADPQSSKVDLERRGDESQGFDVAVGHTKGDPAPWIVNRNLIFRQGAFIGIAHQMDDTTERRSTRIVSLSAMLADRIAKANAGKTP
ncbi:hypothetical protein [Streptomyces niveus]|uniref:hypothetical protein n=1 Tax=Streptomyces niveus TaxID=193462 RepID=UPI003642C44F